MRTIKNLQDGMGIKIVLKLTNKLKMDKLTAALTSRSEINSLNHNARICL